MSDLTLHFGKTLSASASSSRRKPQQAFRQERLTQPIYDALVTFAFDVLDPGMTGKIEKQLLNDIRDTLADLVRNHATIEKRERLYYIQEFGKEHLEKVEEEESIAYERSVNLSKFKDKDDLEEDEYDYDDKFIAKSDEELEDEEEEGQEPKQIAYIERPSKSFRNAPDPDSDMEEAIAIANAYTKRSRRGRTKKTPSQSKSKKRKDQEEEEPSSPPKLMRNSRRCHKTHASEEEKEEEENLQENHEEHTQEDAQQEEEADTNPEDRPIATALLEKTPKKRRTIVLDDPD